MSNQIGRFEIVSEFTHSDLISVYKASDPESGQTVALKAVPLATLGEHASTVVQAVLEEVEASKGLNSHNITALNGASEIDGHLCASMEYVQGNSIATMLARKEGFSIWDLQDIARQACQGLDHARVHKVLHYSLEPAKIMVQWDGIVKILSYGVSRMSSDAALAAARATTVFHYMSPEQLRGEGVDARSNIFSLGAILYEMMTEHKAFEGESIDQIRQAVLETMPTAVHLVNRKIHSGLSAVIMKALAKDPKERYDSGQDLINDLEKCKENPAKTTLGAKPAVGKPAPSMAKPPVAPTPAPKPPVQPAAFKAAAAAGSPAFTHSPKTAPSPAEFMSRAAESVSEPAAQMSVAAEEEVAAPKITVDPMVDEGHHPATKGPSFSDINELPPLKEVYVAPEPPPAHPVAEQPEPVETVQAKAVVFKNAAPAKPKTPPSVVAKKAVAEIRKTPPKLFMYSIAGAVAVILIIVGGIAYHLHSPEDAEEDNTPNQIAQAPPAQQTPAPQATTPVEAQAPAPAPTPAEITPPPPAEETPAVSVTPKYQEKASKKKGKNRVPAAAPAIIPGQLSIDSNPGGAQVQLDGQPQNGVTPFSLAGLTPGQHTLTISKAGYTADTRSINVTSGGRSSVSVQLAPVAASVAANSSPSGAEVWIDGKDTGRATPAQISIDKPGSHNFTFKKQGYLDESATANLQVGQVTQLSPTLRPLGSTDEIKFARKFGKLLGGSETAGMGTVSIRTTPKGAQIAVNNRIIDKVSPVEFYLNPGNYTVDITLSGFKDVHTVVTVEKNGKVAIDENLDRE